MSMPRWKLPQSGEWPGEEYVLCSDGSHLFAAFFRDGDFLEAGDGPEKIIENVVRWIPFPLSPEPFRYQRAA